MADQRTINIDLHWVDTKVKENGSLELEIGGISPGGKSTKVVVKMDPSTIGYIADDFHRAVADMQKRLDQVKAQLRGQ